MPCGSCIDKLARKLMANHKIDVIRAYELAEKGVECVEARTVTKEEMETLGFDPDYSVPCDTPKNMPCPDGLTYCVNNVDCTQGTCPAATCPIPPKPNSHYVSNTCVSSIVLSCVRCLINECRETGSCAYTGLCYYDCDDGYVWNPVTQQCELIPVVGEARWDGYYFLDTG